jgi:hypothetical protein
MGQHIHPPRLFHAHPNGEIARDHLRRRQFPAADFDDPIEQRLGPRLAASSYLACLRDRRIRADVDCRLGLPVSHRKCLAWASYASFDFMLEYYPGPDNKVEIGYLNRIKWRGYSTRERVKNLKYRGILLICNGAMGI